MRQRSLFSISPLFFLASALLLGAETRVVDLPPFAAAAQDLLAEANRAAPAKGEDSVVMLDGDRWIFDKNGDERRTMHVIAQLATAQGVLPCYEQPESGVMEGAASDYSKVRDEEGSGNLFSSYALAQRRLAILKKR